MIQDRKETWIASYFSKGYNLLTKTMFKTEITDFQCGLKAVNEKVVQKIVPKIKAGDGFLTRSFCFSRSMINIRYNLQIPVVWKESNKSKVNKLNTILEYTAYLIKLRRRMR